MLTGRVSVDVRTRDDADVVMIDPAVFVTDELPELSLVL